MITKIILIPILFIAMITRDKDTKQATLSVESRDNWSLYAGSSEDNIDFTSPILTGSGSGNFVLNVDNSARSYFYFRSLTDSFYLAEEHLPMEGGFNFRDLGGIKTLDGRYVKWGKVIRSDDLHKLTDADLKYLSSIPLASIVDFRSEAEMEKAPNKYPVSLKAYYPYSITPGNLAAVESVSKLSSDQLDDLMMDMNRLLVTDSVCVDRYRSFFQLLQNEENLPLMFHCTAGKDRTGMGAALFLFSLGVDEDVVYDNYLKSNIYLGNKYALYMKKYPHLRPLLEVKADFLKAGLEQIKADHGTIDNYLINILEVDIPKMRKMYLSE